MGVKRTGDWDKVRARLNSGMGPRLANALRQATIRNALFLVREIQRGIRSQAPGGQSFAKLAESTIARKGSSKALIDTGFLINAITQKIMADRAFVGLLRGTVNKDGEDMVNIGAVMEYGATIKHSCGATIIIPPRPFLQPVMKKYRYRIIENYIQAIKSVGFIK
jgi:phage gpG-like protein